MPRLVSTLILALAGLFALGAAQPATQPPRPTTRLDNALGIVLQKGTEQGLETVQASSGRGWVVTDGEAKFKNETLNHPGIDPKLRIDRLQPGDDSVLVQVVLTLRDRPDDFVKGLANAPKEGQPTLVDGKNRKYPAVGFIYKDPALTRIRFTRGTPIEKFNDLPALSRSSPNRELTLIFSVRLGVEVKEFRIGDTVMEIYSPALKCDQPQKS